MALSGIAPSREDGVIRPLIDCTREDVLAFLEHRGLSFREDPSNSNLHFKRVRIRKKLLPLLREENPDLLRSLALLADDARDLKSHLELGLRDVLQKAQLKANELDVGVLLASPIAIRRQALKVWVQEQTGQILGRAQHQQLNRVLPSGGEVLLPGQWLLRVRKSVLIALKVSEYPTRTQR
ncbi:MAG: hypothetical protein IPJ88_15875 [Myxococcales bacterium]|nr:MAG: hypothetical protein IPJ88_15875 [Myxococcales bacterium]